MAEYREGLEFRVAGRTLSGVALRYGDTSSDYRERFAPGALRHSGRIDVNLQHDAAVIVARNAVLNDGPRALEVRAELPAASAALALVRRGALNGFSIEFHSRAERREGGIRVVERADLTGLALVDRGAYPQSKAEVRARSGRTMRSRVPYNRRLACDCIAKGGSGAACVPLAKFAKVAGDGMAEAIETAFRESGRDILAVHKDYSKPLASASKGTLRARSTDDGLEVEIDLPAGAMGDDVVTANEAAGLVIRPLVDYDRSKYVDTDEGREVTQAFLRAFLVGATDAKGGWPEPKIDYGDPERSAPEPRRRRVWL